MICSKRTVSRDFTGTYWSHNLLQICPNKNVGACSMGTPQLLGIAPPWAYLRLSIGGGTVVYNVLSAGPVDDDWGRLRFPGRQ